MGARARYLQMRLINVNCKDDLVRHEGPFLRAHNVANGCSLALFHARILTPTYVSSMATWRVAYSARARGAPQRAVRGARHSCVHMRVRVPSYLHERLRNARAV